MYQRSQKEKIMMLVLQLRHEGRHCMDRIGKRTGCKETQDRRYSQQIHKCIFFMAKKNYERTLEREVRTVLFTLNLDAVAYFVQRVLSRSLCLHQR